MREQRLKRDFRGSGTRHRQMPSVEYEKFNQLHKLALAMGTQTEVLSNPDFDAHGHVLFVTDHVSGMRATIATHSTLLGPAVGGCRMMPYASRSEALADVLCLSRAMSYKNVIAALPLGGGMAVIIGQSVSQKTDALLEAYAQAVNAFGGQYVTTKDVGITVGDLERVAKQCRFVTGLRAAQGYVGGAPTQMTSLDGREPTCRNGTNRSNPGTSGGAHMIPT
jgi:glutamate dehydrogenase/leucine dehydrogenase